MIDVFRVIGITTNHITGHVVFLCLKCMVFHCMLKRWDKNGKTGNKNQNHCMCMKTLLAEITAVDYKNSNNSDLFDEYGRRFF